MNGGSNHSFLGIADAAYGGFQTAAQSDSETFAVREYSDLNQTGEKG